MAVSFKHICKKLPNDIEVFCFISFPREWYVITNNDSYGEVNELLNGITHCPWCGEKLDKKDGKK